MNPEDPTPLFPHGDPNLKTAVLEATESRSPAETCTRLVIAAIALACLAVLVGITWHPAAGLVVAFLLLGALAWGDSE